MADVFAGPHRYSGPRFRLGHPAPGCMCRCGHREGSHNDISRCCANECSCGDFTVRGQGGGFDPVPGSLCAEEFDRIRTGRESGGIGEGSDA